MLLRFKDERGYTVLINSDHVVFVGQAASEPDKQPILGCCIAKMATGEMIMLRTSTDDFADVMNVASGRELLFKGN